MSTPPSLRPGRCPAEPRQHFARVVALLLATLVLPTTPAGAATLVDPTDTNGVGRIRLDAEASGVLDRDFRFKAADVRVGADLREFALSGSYGLLEDLDGFLTLGASRLGIEDETALGGAFDGKLGFAFGGGLRYRFINERLFKVGARLELMRSESTRGDVTATWVDYDLLLGVSLHVFRDLVPYFAVAASIVDGAVDGPFGRVSFRQEDVVGAVAGLRYAATSQVKATLAGRFFDQTAVAFSLSFAF